MKTYAELNILRAQPGKATSRKKLLQKLLEAEAELSMLVIRGADSKASIARLQGTRTRAGILVSKIEEMSVPPRTF